MRTHKGFENSAYLGALTKNQNENGAYLAPQKFSKSAQAADEKFILEYGESLVEGDIRPIIIKNYKENEYSK